MFLRLSLTLFFFAAVVSNVVGQVIVNEDAPSGDDASSNYYSDDYDSHYEIPCQHSGDMAVWQILSVRDDMSATTKLRQTTGFLKITDTCMDFGSDDFHHYFGISQIERVGDRYLRLYRDRPDELFDIMEIREGMGRFKGQIMILIGLKTVDNHIKGTAQIMCRKATSAGKNMGENKVSRAFK